MKFAAALIKIFSGALTAVVFGAFLYYTYQYQTTKDAEDLFTANMALIVFLISSVCFALLFILFDVYQSKNTESDLVKLLKSSDLNENSEKTNIADLLVKIASSSNMTNQILDGHFKELNNGLNTLNNSSEINGTNFQATLDQLTVICGEISQYVDSIKNENAKENQRAAGHSGNFDVLVTTVSRLSSDLNNLNGRMLDVVNQISKNVTTSIQSHTDIDNEIKDLLTKLLLAKNGVSPEIPLPAPQPQNTPQDNDALPPAEEEADEPEPQSVADFYEQHFKDIQENEEEKAEAVPTEVSEDEEVLDENESRIDELLTAPATDEVIAPQSLDLTEPQTESIAENQAADDTAEQEAKEPWAEPMAAEISDAEQEYSAQPDEQPIASEPYAEQPLELPAESYAEQPAEQQAEEQQAPVSAADEEVIPAAEAEEQTKQPIIAEPAADWDNTQNFTDSVLQPEDFELPAEVSSPDLPAAKEEPVISDEPAIYDKPKNEPYFEQAPVKIPASDFSLEASDPFNPSPEHFEDLKQAVQTRGAAPVSLDLQDEEPVSLDLPNEESNVKLDDIFNDDFASEMADLDILKDDTNNQNTGEISVEDLLADDKDPYNPNK